MHDSDPMGVAEPPRGQALQSHLQPRPEPRPGPAPVPRLSIGLPVFNGARYLATSLDALLGQSFGDFELILADNASTDGTEQICRRYAAQDPRIRYYRQPRNVGSTPNHNLTVEMARGELFKWASYDDLYAWDLLESCVELLDRHPDVVLAHSWSATIDQFDNVVRAPRYPLVTDAAAAPERFQSLLVEAGGDDYYGVVRTEVLRRVAPQGSFHHSDRTIVAALSLHGPFQQVPDWRYFRRDHPAQAERAFTSMRPRCANMDPRRADRLRHPAVRLYGEYLWAYVAAIRNAPLSSGDRLRCYRHLASWAASRVPGTERHRSRPVERRPVTGEVPAGLSVEALVPRRADRAAPGPTMDVGLSAG